MTDQVVTLRITADGKVAVAAVREVSGATREMAATAQAGGRTAAKGMETAAESAKRLTGATSDAKSSMLALVAAAGGLAAATGLARAMIGAADAAGQLRARLQLATDSAAEYAEVQARIEQVARSSYKSVADVTEVFVRSAGPMRQLGMAARQTLDLTEALSLGLVVSAANVQKSASAIDAFGKAMQTGALRGEELKTITQSAPSFISALETALGKTRAELIAMADAGELTVAELAKVSGQLGELRAAAESMPVTLEDAMTRFRDSFMKFADQANTSTGAVDKLTKGIDWLGEHLQELTIAALAAVAVFATRFVASQVAAAASMVVTSLAARAVAAEMGIAVVASRGMGAAALALAGGPIGVLALAVGGLVAAWQFLAAAEEERRREFDQGIQQMHRGAEAARDLAAGFREITLVPFKPLPDFDATLKQYAENFDLLSKKQDEYSAKRAQLEAVEWRIKNAMESFHESAALSLPRLTDEAERLREELADLDPALATLQAGTDQLGGVLNTALTPALNAAADALQRVTQARSVDGLISSVMDGVSNVFSQFGAVGKNIAAWNSANAALNQSLDGVKAKLETHGKTTAQIIAAQFEAVKSTELWSAASEEQRAKLEDVVAQRIREANSMEKTARAQREQISSGAQLVARLMEEADAYGLAGAALERYRIAKADLTPEEREQANALIDQIDEWDQLADVLEKAAGGLDQLRGMHQGIDDELADMRAELSGASKAQLEFNRTQREAARAYAVAAAAMDPSAAEAYAEVMEKAREKLSLQEQMEDWETLKEIFDDLGGGDTFDNLVKKIEKVEEAMRAACDPKTAKALEEVLNGLEFQKAGAYLERSASNVADGLRSLQSMSEEGSRSYQAMEIAIQAANIAAGIGAIMNQGMGDPYTAFARMAAMAAMVAQMVDGIKNFAGGGFSDTAAKRQASQGTGSVLGDAEADSESIANGVEITAQATSELVGINRGMLRALIALQDGIGGAAGMLARGAGDVDFSDMNLAVGQSKFWTQFDFAGILGGKSKITDQGILIMGGALMEMLESISVGAYQEVQSRSWAFGSTHTREGVQDITDEVGAQFQLIMSSIVDTVREGALALGLLPADIEAALAAFQLEEIRISLKGLSAEEQQAELQAVFSSIFDGLAGHVVPFIEQFQRLGEGLGETLVRVATQVQVVQVAFDQLGLAVNTDKLGPERMAQIADGLVQAAGGLDEFMSGLSAFMGAFASDAHLLSISATALHSAFAQAGLSLPATEGGMWDLMQSLEATTAEGQEQIATLLRLAEATAQYYDLLEQATEFLDERGLGTGGLSAFGQSLADIRREGASAAEAANAIARAQGRQGASAIQLARISQWTADQIAAAVRRLQQETQDIIADLYGGIPGTLDAIESSIADLEGSLSGGIGALEDAGANLFESWLRGVQSIQEYLDSMLLGPLSALSPEDQLAEAQRQLLAAQAAAVGGDTEALALLPQMADAYLRLLQESAASGADYNTGFQWVRDLLQSVVGMTNPYGEDGGTNTVELVPSAELLALYAARDALLAEEELARRRALAEQLAQNLRDLSDYFQVPVLEWMAAQGVALDALATDLGVTLDDMTMQSVQALGDMAMTLGVPLAELTASLGLTLPELAAGLTGLTDELGIDLNNLTAESVETLALLAASLNADLSDLATSLGLELGSLTDVQSLLSEALAAQIASLPAEQSELLAPLLEAIAAATTEADANAAMLALEDAINLLAPDIRTQLAPYLAGVFPADALRDLDYLEEMALLAGDQLDMLSLIRDNLKAANIIAGIPSYAVGTGYVPSTGIAMLHEGETVIPAPFASWLREHGFPAASNDDPALVAEVRALREEVIALRRDNNQGHNQTAATVASGDARAYVQREDLDRRNGDAGRGRERAA